MYYPAILTPCDTGFLVRFVDIPEAITEGKTLEDALNMAKDALCVALQFYAQDRRIIPMPSPLKEGAYLIALPVTVWLKVLLLNEMHRQNLSYAALARRMGASAQSITRLVDLSHNTKADTLADALCQLGMRLVVQLEDAKDALTDNA